MPRYLVERSSPQGLAIPSTSEGAELCADIIARNTECGVTWLKSYVAPDRGCSFCICDAPNPEALRAASQRSGLVVTRITEVRVFDPYFHH